MKLFLLVMMQNAFATLMARARNSDSYKYNGVSSLIYHTVWFFTFKEIAENLNHIGTVFYFVAGATCGCLLAQFYILKYIERN